MRLMDLLNMDKTMAQKPILLIRPPLRFLANRNRAAIDLPVGLLYISSILEREGHKVRLIDGVMPSDDYNQIHSSENYFGITFEYMEEMLSGVDFDISGISAQYTVQFPNAIRMAELLKRINPNCKILIGGAHATIQHREVITENICFDVAIRGEGERTVINVVNAIQGIGSLQEIKGITYRDNGQIIETDPAEFIIDMDNIPFPAYHLVDMERYFGLAKKYASRTAYTFSGWERGVSLITSRGCPYHCSFCSINLHMGRRWRYHSPEYVLNHMEHLMREYGVKYFHFEDDNLTANPKRFEKILDGIIARRYDIRWDTPNGVRADTLSLDLLKKCAQTGCTFLTLGVESGVQRVLDDVICKNTKIEDIEKVASLAQKAKVNTRAFYLIGTPGETAMEINSTVTHAIKMIKEYDCFGSIGIVTPLYGTRVYENAIRNGYLIKEMTSENIARGYNISGMLKTDEFDPDFLSNVLEDFGKKLSRLLKWIFLRRICTNSRLFFYCVKSFFTVPISQWGSIYYKIIFSNHALLWDIEHDKN